MRERLTGDGWHGFSCLQSEERFSGYSNLNALIKLSLSSTRIPSVLEPRHLYRTDQQQPYGLKLVPRAVAQQLLWVVTVVDSLGLIRRLGTSSVSVCNLGTVAAEADER